MRKRNRKTLPEKVVDAIELPKEIVLSVPKITVLAGKEAFVENYKGIIELSREKIRLYTGAGVLCLTGTGLDISAITDEDISILGSIDKIEFE
ncbi:MAG: sporulation protein YqfC [Ruminococcaceae bacterium]|nr:sporulation protein YqfC [Oscillospiraceae bacterium]